MIKRIFDIYPFTIVSTEFIKSERRRDDFKRTCPELVIVDEAHTCAFGQEKGRHLRHELISKLAARPEPAYRAGNCHAAQRQRRSLPLAADLPG